MLVQACVLVVLMGGDALLEEVCVPFVQGLQAFSCEMQGVVWDGLFPVDQVLPWLQGCLHLHVSCGLAVMSCWA